eukprot:3896837-Prymnesium_polylepis.1
MARTRQPSPSFAARRALSSNVGRRGWPATERARWSERDQGACPRVASTCDHESRPRAPSTCHAHVPRALVTCHVHAPHPRVPSTCPVRARSGGAGSGWGLRSGSGALAASSARLPHESSAQDHATEAGR